MACFPLMIEIEGKTVIVIGGGRIALHKIKVLLPFGARIVAVSEEFCDELMELAADNLRRITLLQESFNGSILNFGDSLDNGINSQIDKILNMYGSVCFVIAATDDERLQSIVSRVCKEKNIPVNVVDVRGKSSFYFPAVAKQYELVIAISTGGNSPVAAGYIKKKIEDYLPVYYGKMIDALGRLREQALAKIDSYDKRKKYFRELIKYGEEHDGDIPEEIALNMMKQYYNESE